MSSPARSLPPPSRRIGRYALYDEVGHGGTATVHLGRLTGPAGFSKTVAIKQMREYVGRDPAVVAMFLDEARLSGRIRHPNVVATTDLLSLDGDLFLVMEYVHGETLAALQAPTLEEGASPLPPAIAAHVLGDALAGLHAAHEALDEQGRPLGLVHRDVSPQNIQVGVDGVARVLDFGIAQALGRLQETHTGQVKGKIAYMAPEQLLGQPLDRRTDIFAAGVVLWELLAGQRLFQGKNPGETVQRVLSSAVPDLEELRPSLPPALCAVVRRAMARAMEDRFSTALEFAQALEAAIPPLSPRTVGAWVTERGGAPLAERSLRLREIESSAPPIELLPPQLDAASLLLAEEDESNVKAKLAPRARPPSDATQTDVTSILPAPHREREETRDAAPSALAGALAQPSTPRARRPWLIPAAACAAAAGAVLWFTLPPTTSAASAPESAGSPAAEPSEPAALAPALPAAAEAPAPHPPAAAPEAGLPTTDTAPPSASAPPARPQPPPAPPKTTTSAPKPKKPAAAPSPRAEDLFSRN